MQCGKREATFIIEEGQLDIKGIADLMARFITKGDPIGYINEIRRKKESRMEPIEEKPPEGDKEVNKIDRT